VTPRIASLGLRLVVSEHMDTGAVGDTEIRAIVDEIVLPLTEPR
jgi:hypothetical protein